MSTLSESLSPENKKPLLLCGPSGVGKTTLAKKLIKKYQAAGLRVIHLDGDDMRSTINSDLSFIPKDIMENARRAIGITQLLLNTNQADKVIVSIIAPHAFVRNLFMLENFTVISLHRPECYTEDLKGLYKKGKQVPYEEPTENLDVTHVLDLNEWKKI